MRWCLAATGLLVTGHFVAYTYVRPLLAGVAGNFVVGATAARRPARAILLITLALAVAILLLALLRIGPIGTVVLLMAWGLAYGGVSVGLQTWILSTAPRAAEPATALFVTVFNLSIALGALIGAVAVDVVGTVSTTWIAVGILLPTTLIVNPAQLPDPVSYGHSHIVSANTGRLVVIGVAALAVP